MMCFRSRGNSWVLLVVAVVAGLAFLSVQAAAQTSTGSIVGTVTDQQGSSVADVIVTIQSVSTGSVQKMKTTSTGTYSAIALEPGDYVVSFEAKGFRPGELKLSVRIGQASTGDFVLQVGSESTVITVESTAVAVNTVQATVQDVMTGKEIDSLPLNGRNFLDLAQLNPGVQIGDGGNFDPTKNGFTGISMQGRSGRSTRIQVDGIDITDETVGTTTMNISEDSIQEFQVAQSTLDPATSLTSSGSVNVVTRSGGNKVHGSGFYYFRGNHIAARVGQVDAPFDRQQGGFRLGGPFLKDKLFWFVNYERTVQDGTTFTNPPAPFSPFVGAFPSPFHETMGTGRLDYNLTKSWRTFYSFHHDQLNGVTGYGGNFLSPFSNRNITDSHTAALDGANGKFTHSFRFGYVRFRNEVADARSQVAGLPAAFPGGQPAAVAIGNDPLCLFGTDVLCLGPNFLAPQFTLQRNLQISYDGSVQVRSHTIRYGVQYLRIPEAVFANFVGLGPILNSNNTQTEVDFANTNPFGPGGASNPLNYPLQLATFGNGLGFFSELEGLGHPHGATNARRFATYIGDIWKLKPNLTVNLALRYGRDWGRINHDLPGFAPLEVLVPGAGRPVDQPNLSFAPQIGIAWDPFKTGKTSIRAGIGIFYDNILFNTSLFDRTLKIPAGLGNAVFVAGSGVLPGTTCDVSPLIGQPIGSVVDQVVACQAAFQAANLAAAQNFDPNGPPGFLDPNVFDFNSFGSVLDPNYHTPYSTQLNVGIQRQLTKSLFISVDYLHNTNVHYPLTHDVNFVGSVGTFNLAAAQAAISATLANCGVSTIAQAITLCPNDPQATGNPYTPRPATIADFAGNGLGSPARGLNGQFVPPGNGFAFGGLSQSFGQVGMISMIGRSTYSALQVRLHQELDHPVRGIRHMSWTANYNLSRLNAMSGDQDFLKNATDNIDLQKWYGPNNLDRTHIITFTTTIDLPGAVRVSLLGRISTALPATLTVPLQCNCPAEIFLTDLTGDGTGGDVLPGTNLGAFGRSVKLGDLNNTISNYNSSVAGGFTPAGQTLITAGLFTANQLRQLGGVIPSLQPAPSGEVALDSFIANDLRVSWRMRPAKVFHRWPEGLIIEPSLDVFNLLNIANYDPPNGIVTSSLRGALDGTPGSLNGTTQALRTNRFGLGSGVFSQGLPRSVQLGVRFVF